MNCHNEMVLLSNKNQVFKVCVMLFKRFVLVLKKDFFSQMFCLNT